MASMNTELITDIDSVVDAAIRAGASGMSGYIIPAAWVIIAISMLVWAILVANGKVESPMQDWLIKIGFFLFVISAAGGMYGDWLVKALRGLQTDLPSVMIPNGGNATNMIDALDRKILNIVDSCFATMGNLPKNAVGIPDIPSVLALLGASFLFFFAGGVLELVAVFNIIYAKLGLALVLMVGPFFVASLIVTATRGWFHSWLNTALYFVMLSTLVAAWIAMCLTLADKYLGKIMAAASIPTAGVGYIFVKLDIIVALLMASFNFLLIALILGFLGWELRTIASSITGGSGGTAGTGAAAMGRALTNRTNRKKDQALQERQASAAEALAKAATK
jgi:type IV secretion system protein VirB6